MNIKDTMLINEVFTQEEFLRLKNTMYSLPKTKESYDQGFNRYHVFDPILLEYTKKALPIARKYFNSETLVPSYTLFSHYQGENPNLFKHKDDNACTYTVDMCVYQTNPWDLWVDDKPYTLFENQALAYYGNEQMHWREKFPHGKEDFVAMVFFHFVEPDHWWVTKGPRYIDVIRKNITEEEFLNEHSNN